MKNLHLLLEMEKKKITIDENIVDFIKTSSPQLPKDTIKEVKYIIDQYLKNNEHNNHFIKELKDNIHHLYHQQNIKDETIEIISKDIDFIKNHIENGIKNILFELENIREYINQNSTVKTTQKNKDDAAITLVENIHQPSYNDLNKINEKASLNQEIHNKQNVNINKDSHKKRIDVIANMNYLNKELNKKIKD